MAKLIIYNYNSQEITVTVNLASGPPINDATVTFTLKSSNGTTILSGNCAYVSSSNGSYVYQILADFFGVKRGDYKLDVKIVDSLGNESNIRKIVELRDRS